MSLPLKAKVALRDKWEKKDSPIQTAIKEVKDVLGLDVYCEPEWPILISELESVYDDKAQLIEAVIGILQVWFSTLAEILDDSTQEVWSEKVVEKIHEFTSRLNVVVEASDTQQASTEWSDTRKGFLVCVPKVHVYQPAQFGSQFKDHLLDCFEAKQQSSRTLPIHSTTGDEWADVGIDEEAEKPSKVVAAKSEASVVEFLPDANALPKPGTLLLKPPYHLFIHALGNNKVEIECSHAATLEVLSDYLKRWCRTNQNLTTKPPAVNITLNQGTCGFGLTYDTLTLFSENRYGGIFTISPTLILHLVEGHFGYEKVYSDASTWHYRRDTPFKKA
ncbi:hypothetical protein B0J13DRAFT_44282 [Dactylonectria estremocensis]|uniref:Uncharacterized protein n=1 Tax=Dactylonectria estremocensis TaxID=1079267 RepID=A0A9P9EU72_9HYPO|nr:hypothetical protein B0J13DRAFT_44282 [Dactylonectria estremocensis]